MSEISLTQQLDLAITNMEYEKFIAFYGQYCIYETSKEQKREIIYKTIALLYFLSCGNNEKYYALLQTCEDVENYENILNVYNAMNICDCKKLQLILDNSSDEYKELIRRIIINSQNTMERKVAEEYEEELEDVLRQNIKNILNVIKEHNK